MRMPVILAALVLSSALRGGGLFAQEGAIKGFTGAASPAAAEGRPAPRGADFQPYIFWAYSLACTLILVFTLWTHSQEKRVGARLGYLRERFQRAHPGVLEDENS